jgi:hypothetical protein
LPFSSTALFAGALVYVAIGSFLHHACECALGDQHDLRSISIMLVVSSHLVLIPFGLTMARFILVLLMVVATLKFDDLYAEWSADEWGVWCIGGGGALVAFLVVVTSVCVLFAEVGRKELITTLLCTLIAVGAWVPEEWYDNCDLPVLHALWHVFLGIALFFLYLFVEKVVSHHQYPISLAGCLHWGTSNVVSRRRRRLLRCFCSPTSPEKKMAVP